MPDRKDFVQDCRAWDLSSMFAEWYCFKKPVDEKIIGDLGKSTVKAAGLELVTCYTYSSLWAFSSADACLGELAELLHKPE
ncbi:hypothetical protein MRX96_021007 [Rhipicephalus microplus]